jgi:hypothetical protein
MLIKEDFPVYMAHKKDNKAIMNGEGSRCLALGVTKTPSARLRET